MILLIISSVLVALGLALIGLAFLRNIINPRMPHTGKRMRWFINQNYVWRSFR